MYLNIMAIIEFLVHFSLGMNYETSHIASHTFTQGPSLGVAMLHWLRLHFCEKRVQIKFG